MFFFEKKNQKTFLLSPSAGARAPRKRFLNVYKNPHRQSRRNPCPYLQNSESDEHRLGRGVFRCRPLCPGVLAADEAVHIGPAAAAQSYLNIEAIIAACKQTGAQAVHPGYGFLSERVEFARRLTEERIVFIGPGEPHLRDFGLKHTARALAEQAAVPMLPGSGLIGSVEEALREAERITYPVMLKSSAGGGGIGMVLCHDAAELAEKFESIGRLAANNFGNAALFLEKYVARARHVEVQIFGDGKGNVVALGARDCSLQRRNEKVIEETPAPNIRLKRCNNCNHRPVALAASVAYESAGTVEFVYDAEAQKFYFLEVNTRLQVEHGVTEAAFGVDLVAWMIRQAAGAFTLPAQDSLRATCAAIEARIYAEIPAEDFRPASGVITNFTPPPGLRVDTWVELARAYRLSTTRCWRNSSPRGRRARRPSPPCAPGCWHPTSAALRQTRPIATKFSACRILARAR